MGNDLSTTNYLNNLINQQIMQSQFNQAVRQHQTNNPEQAETPIIANSQPDQSIMQLLNLLDTVQASDSGELSLINYAVANLLESGADSSKISDLLSSLAEAKDDILFSRTDNQDPYITIENKIKVLGGDFETFLFQANVLSEKGYDINDYIDTVSNIVSKGDYDDLRRFLGLTHVAMEKGCDLKKLNNYINEMTNTQVSYMESNAYSVQNLIENSANLDQALAIMNSMITSGNQGGNNLTDLTEIIIEAKKRNENVPAMLKEMSDSANAREYMDQWIKSHGIEKIQLKDYSRFERIESIIERDDLIISEGDNVALFGVAVSSTEGVLPPESHYWSSFQTGAMQNGDYHLDLSKLEAGVYDIWVKVGPGYGGTDTARRRVIIRDKEGNMPEIPALPPVFSDNSSGRRVNEFEALKNRLLDSINCKEKNRSEMIKEMYKALANSFSGPDDPLRDLPFASFEKVFERIIDTKSPGDNNWLEKLLNTSQESEDYRKAIKEFREIINKEINQKYLEHKFENAKLLKEEKKKKYNHFFEETQKNLRNYNKENNGLGDQKDNDNSIKFIDQSNPGQRNRQNKQNADNVKLL